MRLLAQLAWSRPAYPNTAIVSRAPTKRWPEIVLGLLALTTTVAPPAVATVLAFAFFLFPFFWWLASGKRWPTELVILIVPFVVMIAAGLVHGFSHSKFEIGKDIWYMGNGALMAGVGFVLCRTGGRFETIARPIVIVGLLAALLHLSRFALHPSILLKPAAAIRVFAGFGYGVASGALIMIVISRWSGIRLFGSFDWVVYPIAAICAASFVLMFSRTSLFAVVIQLTILSGVISLTSPRRVVIYCLVTLLAIVSIASAPLPSSHSSGQGQFVAKILHSFQEVRVDSYYLRDQIQANWRGYETARALRTYRDGNFHEWVFGKGLGTNVDLGLSLNLGGGAGAELIRYAPVLHNGYLFVLVKSGIVGLIALLFWFGYVATIGARAAGASSKVIVLAGRWMVGIVLLMILTNWTTASAFPKTGLTGFLVLGALIGLVTRKEEQKGAIETQAAGDSQGLRLPVEVKQTV